MATQKRELTILDRLHSPAQIEEIRKVIPKHMTAERVVRVCATALLRTPDLAKCSQASFFKCLLDLSAFGLEPDGRRAHLIPFRNNKLGTFECTLIIDYKGLVEMAFRSGAVSTIHTAVVNSGDVFEYDLGTINRHVPWFLRRDQQKPPQEGKPLAVYAIAKMKDGTVQTEIMSADEIEATRRVSKSSKTGPWVNWWGEMAKKTVFKRLAKWLPLSSELQDAVEMDDQVSVKPTCEDLADHMLALPDYMGDVSGQIDVEISADKSLPSEEMKEVASVNWMEAATARMSKCRSLIELKDVCKDIAGAYTLHDDDEMVLATLVDQFASKLDNPR